MNARLRSVLRLAAAGVTAALLGGCSSDVSRLAAGPFGPADNTPTASIGSRALTPPEAVGGASAIAATSAGSWGAASTPVVSAVQSAPLAPLTPPVAAAVSRPSTQAVTSAATSAARAAGGSFGPWTTAGGTAVTVAQGESASVLASRYGVPMEALVRANGLTSASQVTPGKGLIIPVYNAAARRAAGAAPVAPATATAAAAVAAAAVAAPAASRNVARTAAASQAAPTRAAASAPARGVEAAKPAAPAARVQAARPTEAPRKPDPKVVASVEAAKPRVPEASRAGRTESSRAEAQKANEAAQKARESAQRASASSSKPAAVSERQQTTSVPVANQDKPEFRWPARGRIIQGFKSGANDGISIAVPEGTAVKAAEGGVVAYAGNELKGYGNLVLIRHPNGFVSAYAHNGSLNVKRGETVKRGQTIAKSGQSGNVGAPQLHFELRKGSTPVDPTQYLAGI